ncbi:MAG: hypothetical protein ACP5K1_00560 [Candidatus Bathyarchaeia archaeon]
MKLSIKAVSKRKLKVQRRNRLLPRLDFTTPNYFDERSVRDGWNVITGEPVLLHELRCRPLGRGEGYKSRSRAVDDAEEEREKLKSRCLPYKVKLYKGWMVEDQED